MKKIRDQVPYCAGRNFPKYHIPKGACDCHHHIYDPVRYAYQPSDTRNQPPSTVDVYRMLQKKLGLSRNVIVQPSAYGTDNRCTLDALRAMGKEQTRAIVINTARSGIIDDAALLEAVKNGHVLGAGLDCTEETPISKDNPLLQYPNFIVTPHVGGVTNDIAESIMPMIVENLRLIAKQESPKYVVNNR